LATAQFGVPMSSVSRRRATSTFLEAGSTLSQAAQGPDGETDQPNPQHGMPVQAPTEATPLPVPGSDGIGSHRPRWDKHLRELWLGPHLIKWFRVPAPDQERILDAFEEEGWPASIDDPLPPRTGRPRPAYTRRSTALMAAKRPGSSVFEAMEEGPAYGGSSSLLRRADARSIPNRHQMLPRRTVAAALGCRILQGIYAGAPVCQLRHAVASA
jgi:hypothetical protein